MAVTILALSLFLLSLSIYTYGASAVETFANLDTQQYMLDGRQEERTKLLHFRNVCKCQCKDLAIFDNGLNGYKGNCRTNYNGRNWCYISNRAARHCHHVENGRNANSKWSFDACYTPAEGEGPCARSFQDTYSYKDYTSRLAMCGLKRGTFPPKVNNTADIVSLCYVGQRDFPDQGCQEPVETEWGPAKPCRCTNTDPTPGVRVVGRVPFQTAGGSAPATPATRTAPPSWTRRARLASARSASGAGSRPRGTACGRSCRKGAACGAVCREEGRRRGATVAVVRGATAPVVRGATAAVDRGKEQEDISHEIANWKQPSRK